VKAAQSLADPTNYSNLFPDFALALKAEEHFRTHGTIPALAYSQVKDDLHRDLIQELRDLEAGVIPAPKSPAPTSRPQQPGSPKEEEKEEEEEVNDIELPLEDEETELASEPPSSSPPSKGEGSSTAELPEVEEEEVELTDW